MRAQRRFVFFGRRSWWVRTAADRKGGNVSLRIDDETGEILSKAFARR